MNKEDIIRMARMSIDVMKQALDALERGETKLRYETITALRAAIEQIHTSVFSNTHQCKQEPVAWAVELPDGTRKPLYTHPPEFTCSTGLCHYKKPLTDDEVFELADINLYDGGKNYGVLAFAQAIEAKLIEKNK
jgi:hypothetical protein